jgi:hypothetical protein
MQFPQGYEQTRMSSPPQAEFGHGPLISAKDAVCCAGATEFQEAQEWLLLIAQIKRCV